MRTRSGSFSKLRASIRRSSAKLVQKLKGSPDGPNDASMGGYVSDIRGFRLRLDYLSKPTEWNEDTLVYLYVFSHDNSKKIEARLTRFGTHGDLEVPWCCYKVNLGFRRSEVRGLITRKCLNVHGLCSFSY